MGYRNLGINILLSCYCKHQMTYDDKLFNFFFNEDILDKKKGDVFRNMTFLSLKRFYDLGATPQAASSMDLQIAWESLLYTLRF